jgi:hypothetical protein
VNKQKCQPVHRTLITNHQEGDQAWKIITVSQYKNCENHLFHHAKQQANKRKITSKTLKTLKNFWKHGF